MTDPMRYRVAVWSRRGGRGGWYWRIEAFGHIELAGAGRGLIPRRTKASALRAAQRWIDRKRAAAGLANLNPPPREFDVDDQTDR